MDVEDNTLRRYFTLWGHSLVPSLISWGLCLTAGFSIFDAVNDCKHGLMQLNSICLYTVVPWCDKHWLQNIYTIWCILQCKTILIMISFLFFCGFYNFHIAKLDFSEKHSICWRILWPILGQCVLQCVKKKKKKAFWGQNKTETEKKKPSVKYLRFSRALARNSPVNLTQLLGCRQMQLHHTEILTACNLWHWQVLRGSGEAQQLNLT